MKTVIKTPIGRPLSRSYLIPTFIALGFFAFLHKAQAVSPPPDGGYPGQNTAEGQSALLHLAGGTYNTALGWASLGFNVTGNFNTGVGAVTLYFNTGDQNTANGAAALVDNTGMSTQAAEPSLSLATPRVNPTRPTVLVRSRLTPPGSKTRPLVKTLSRAFLQKTGLTSNQCFSPHFAKEFCSRLAPKS
jgi:hypothetical protein